MTKPFKKIVSETIENSDQKIPQPPIKLPATDKLDPKTSSFEVNTSNDIGKTNTILEGAIQLFSSLSGIFIAFLIADFHCFYNAQEAFLLRG